MQTLFVPDYYMISGSGGLEVAGCQVGFSSSHKIVRQLINIELDVSIAQMAVIF
jgi:hypothetical protein